MKYFLVLGLVAGTAWGSTGFAAEVIAEQFYIGQQEVDLAGATVDCYVGATFSADGKKVNIRAVAVDAHEGEQISFGPVEATYQNIPALHSDGYYYSSSVAQAEIKELALVSATPENPSNLTAVYFHAEEGHYDDVSCAQLQKAPPEQSADLQKIFESAAH